MSENVAQQDEALLLLATGKSVRETAAQIGLNERTIYRWREDVEFLKREKEIRTELFTRSLAKLSEGTTEAADTLRALLKSENENIRLKTSQIIITAADELRKTIDMQLQFEQLKVRLAELKQQVEESKDSRQMDELENNRQIDEFENGLSASDDN
jgi:hypothetical protein